MIAVFSFTLITTILSLIAPYLLGNAVDHYIIPGDFKGLMGLCVVLLAVYAGTAQRARMSWLRSRTVYPGHAE